LSAGCIFRSRAPSLYHGRPATANREFAPGSPGFDTPRAYIVGWQAMREAVALVMPALDEEAALGPTLEGLRGAGFAQIIVVDNGSRDRTAEVAASHGAEVVRESRRGYGAACLAGIAALRPEITAVVFMDADGASDPADLPALLAPLEQGAADLVVGSRARGESEPGALTPAQRFGNALAARLLRLFFGARTTDLGPFRAVRRAALERLGMRDPDYGWTIEMQIRAHRAGLRIAEVPVRHRRRRLGRSKVSGTLRGSLAAGAKILWTILKHRLAR
jgi:glycosyltransferase involved in cell wall biosynthesis